MRVESTPGVTVTGTQSGKLLELPASGKAVSFPAIRVLRIAKGNAASRALALSCGYRLTDEHAELCKGEVALIYTKSLASD